MINTLLSVLNDVAATADTTSVVPSVEQIKSSFLSGELQHAIVEGSISLGKKLLIAIIVFIVGKIIITKLRNIVFKIMEKRGVEASLASFCRSLINVVLYFALIIIIIDILGLETSSFVALFASAGVAIGMALSGTLQNFAGGVMILLFRPFRVGHYISAQGLEGTVKDIQIFNTIIYTADGKTVIMPNGALSTNVLVNYSTVGSRRVEWTASIAYGDDVDLARNTLKEILSANDKILKEPSTYIAVMALNSSSVDFAVHAWVKCEDYWGVLHSVNEQIYKQFNQKGLSIPYQQMDVHIINQK